MPTEPGGTFISIDYIVYYGKWSCSTTKSHRDWVFVFGDNDQGHGEGGQAIIRREPNAFGIPTKRSPDTTPKAYYSDRNYDEHVDRIGRRFDQLERMIEGGRHRAVVFSSAGLGTGLADLPRRAPKVYNYLVQRMTAFRERFRYVLVEGPTAHARRRCVG